MLEETYSLGHRDVDGRLELSALKSFLVCLLKMEDSVDVSI